jgi:Holliday junction resolvasome RuvABC endonuclease subunit
MRILALDLSLSVGWAVLDGSELSHKGLIRRSVEDWKADIHTYEHYSPLYPQNMLKVANQLCLDILRLCHKYKPDLVVIEEINIGRSSKRFSQKMIDWIHFTVCTKLQKKFKVRYLTSTCWRRAVGAVATKADKSMNAKISRLKTKRRKELEKRTDISQAEKDRLAALPIKVDGKVKGRLNHKHYAIRTANALFGLSLKNKDDDVADAVCLGVAAWKLFGGADDSELSQEA